ncbi:hypothetical protein J1N35_046206, partial [Gossypium stocksii]
VALKCLLNRKVRPRLLQNLLIGIDRSINQLVKTFSMDKTKGNNMATTLTKLSGKKKEHSNFASIHTEFDLTAYV